MTDPPVASTPERAIRSILRDLVAQRRRLERDGAGDGLLSANRLAIAYWHERLAREVGPADPGYTGRRVRM